MVARPESSQSDGLDFLFLEKHIGPHLGYPSGWICGFSIEKKCKCELKWALGSITMNKDSGGDGISVELFQILKDDAVRVPHSICQQIWKTQ